MKKLLILICSFALGISFLNAAAFAQSLAVIDTNKIFEQSKHGQSNSRKPSFEGFIVSWSFL